MINWFRSHLQRRSRTAKVRRDRRRQLRLEALEVRDLLASSARLLSAPYTADTGYLLRYEVDGAEVRSAEVLQLGSNELRKTLPDGQTVSFQVTRVATLLDGMQLSYDTMGNVSASTDSMGRTITFQHDGLGRPTTIQGPVSSEIVSFAYDANDNVTKMQDATGHAFYTYDKFDRVTSIARSLDNQSGNVDDIVVNYTYDAVGNTDTIRYPDGTIVDYDYFADNHLKQVTEGAWVTRYEYYADGQLKTATLPNGITSSYSYNDVAGRLTDIVHKDSAGLLVSSFRYTLDANGNRTSMEVRRPNSSTTDPTDYFSSLYQYEYDARDQLTRAIYPDGKVESFTYDAAGNRVKLAADADGIGPLTAAVVNYTYTVENRLDRITDGMGQLVDQFFYDPSGNVVMRVTPTKTTRYTYDFRNLLRSVDDGTTLVEYVYDGLGERIARIENGVRVEYVNDPTQRPTIPSKFRARRYSSLTVPSYRSPLNRKSFVVTPLAPPGSVVRSIPNAM